ncbi:MAG: hypothetical protein SFU56_02630 [Capsulimonadales bacterium]|nr:hypothetical protein [Capsulimonadales bacterium]
MPEFDPKRYLIESTERTAARLMNNFNAIPDDRENQCPGGCARSAVHIVAECAVVNGLVATFLETGTVNFPGREEREALLASYDTRTGAREFLSKETTRLIRALEATDPATYGEPAAFFPTRSSDRFGVASLPASHMAYHDGQLAYIQMLYGDAENHW